MRDFGKLVIVGIVGYLIGFYEMKYKAQNAFLKVIIEDMKRDAQK